MYTSDYEGVLFVEGHPQSAQILGHAEITLNGVFTQSHLKTLDDVKKKLAQDARSRGGNSIINFKYGQRASFFSSLIGIDNISWYGSGDVAIISQTDKMNIIK